MAHRASLGPVRCGIGKVVESTEKTHVSRRNDKLPKAQAKRTRSKTALTCNALRRVRQGSGGQQRSGHHVSKLELATSMSAPRPAPLSPRETKPAACIRREDPAMANDSWAPTRQHRPRHALGSWSEFGKMEPHTWVGCVYASPSSWTRYSHRVLGALPKSLSEKLTVPNNPFAL